MIKSESQFIGKFILKILLLPFTLLQVIFRRKQLSALGEPFQLLFDFIQEAKVTFILIIINIAMFISMAFFSESIIMSLLSHPADLLNGNIHTLITAGFLHADIFHLLGNMLALLIFGRVVERELNSHKMLLVYFSALIISNIFSSLINLFILNNNIPGLGASGAIMGLVATAILLDPLYITYQLIIPLPLMSIGWIFIYSDISGVLGGAQDGIGHFAHLGGFISITIIMFFLERYSKERLKRGLIINIISIIVLGALYFVLGKPSL